jgi:exodeoxyribonuclease VII large subunit
VSQGAFDFDAAGSGAGRSADGSDPDGTVDEPDEVSELTYTVGELAGAINDRLRRGFPDGIWVRGEIQGWSERGQHAYFSLVDDSGDAKAVVAVQFFAYARTRLRPLLRQHRLRLGDGLQVRIHGTLDYYAPTGRLGLKMTGIDPVFTLGGLAAERDAVVARLVAGGHYDANRRLPAPTVPLRIGVVTSLGSAAWHDLHDELVRSGYGFQLRVADTRVQGEFAVEMVTASIRELSRAGDLDVIVVVRGGGARNELATFDAETIALAIAASPVPVFTGIGHETDRSVADEVAHTAWKTPTACAGGLVELVRTHLDAVEQHWSAIERSARRDLAGATVGLDDLARRVALRTGSALDRAEDRLQAGVRRLAVRVPSVLDEAERSVGRAVDRLRTRPRQLLEAEQRHLDALAPRVAALDPVVQLARGWSITRTEDGRLVRRVTDVVPGTVLHTQLADGTVTSTSTSTSTSSGPTPTAPETR